MLPWVCSYLPWRRKLNKVQRGGTIREIFYCRRASGRLWISSHGSWIDAFCLLTMIVYVLCTVLAVWAALLYLRNPYLLADINFAISALYVGYRLKQVQRRFYGILDCFLDRVAKHPDKKLIIFEDVSYTYKQADSESNKVARALSAHAQLKPGDTVALFLGNEPMFVWIWLALAKLGCVASLLNSNIRSRSLLHCFSCCGAKVLITSPDLRDAVEEVLPTLREQGIRVFVLGDHLEADGFESLVNKVQEASDQPLSPELRANIHHKSPAMYIYTSGTTGLPKAAIITHQRAWSAALAQEMAGVRSDDIFYLYLPLYHTAGFLMGLCGGINKGLTFVLKRKFSVSSFWDDCRKYNITVIQYIGEIMRYLCNMPKKDNDKDHNVRLAFGNGIRSDTWTEFLERFGNIQICECYGATEANVGFMNYVGKIGALGRENFLHKMSYKYALIRYDTEKEQPFRNAEGFCVQVPKGETGLLVSKIGASTPFSGYANNQQQTERKKLKDVFVKGDLYLNSGDLLRIDDEGFVYFQDRIGDTYRWKGENVATTEVADLLLMVDFVEEANVYGVKVPGHEGRIGMAALKLKENMEFDGRAIYQCVKSNLPAYARPRFIRIQDALSVTGTFKHVKVKLAEEGFNPATIKDPLYFLDDSKGYVSMTQEIFSSMSEGKLRL